MPRLHALALLLLLIAPHAAAQREAGRPELDRSKPVPPKPEIVSAWLKRQDPEKTLRFAWTEQQQHPRGWIPNPRLVQRERLAIPTLFGDRMFAVTKSLTVDGQRIRYSFELDRKEEPDGFMVKSPAGDDRGLGERRHYSYVSTFDGQAGTTRLGTLTGTFPPVVTRTTTNVDAQTIDTRPILMAFRPLDPALGHALIDRAVCNQSRFFYKGRSTMILEEHRDPAGWKTLLWLEPERGFLVSRYLVMFEQRIMIDIDYVHDRRWGWIPSAWRVTEKLNDGTKHVLSTAKVTSYEINP